MTNEMTAEEAIKALNTFKWVTYEQMVGLDYARKLIEQQSFINKPCVSEGVCREDKIQVLDKIRAEIEDLTYYCWEVSPRTVIDDVLEIIDKYKTEGDNKK